MSKSRRKWEYLVYWYNTALDMDMWQDLESNDMEPYHDMAEAGLDGWELVTINHKTKTQVHSYVFKREVTE